ncbi:MAG: VWA domain-containing protein [Lentisphaeraceae bacterium]|nr:VWA domain-containing protein [Lentisphaeraceae bacterium]
MIVFNPIINIAIIAVLAVLLFILTLVVYWKVSSRLELKKRIFLLTCRLLGCAILILILLQPSRRYENPLKKDEITLGLAIDSSKSMLQNDMDGQRRFDLAKTLIEEECQAEDIPLNFFSFDTIAKPLSKENLVKLSAEGDSTKIHNSISDIFQQQNNYSMKALVLFTDGHDFEGEDLSKTARLAARQHCRLFAYPLGHEGKVRDLSVRISASQDYVFKGNKVAISVFIRARSCEYEKIEMQLFKNGQLLENRQILLDDGKDFNFIFENEETKAGVSDYEVKITKLDAEVDYVNNSSTVFVNCTEKQMKTLLIEGEPHWDTTFLRRYLHKNKMVQLDSFTQYRPGKVSSLTTKQGTALPESDEEFQSYDIVLLGRKIDSVLSEKGGESLKNYVQKQGGVVVFTRGNAFDSHNGCALQPVEWDEEGYDEVTLKASSHGERLSLFKTLEKFTDESGLSVIPKLDLSRKIASKKMLTQFLAFAEDDNADNSNALVYRRFGRGQVMSFGVEGLWHWRFNKNYDSNNDFYAAFWNQSMLWLINNSEFIPGSEYSFRHDVSSVTLGSKINFRFSVRQAKNIPKQSPKIKIISEYGTEYSLELKALDKNSPHRFSGTFVPAKIGRYRAQLIDPAGNTQELRFLSFFDSLEEKEVGVDVDYLNSLCVATGGRLLTEEDLGKLHELISQQSEEQVHQRVHLKAVWDKVWLLYLICLFLGLDWYYRRKWGLC